MEQYIKELIYRKLTTGVTASEQAYLEEWMTRSLRNRERYRRIAEDTHFVERYERYAAIDAERAYQTFRNRHRLSSSRCAADFLKYAAVFLLPLLLATGIGFYRLMSSDSLPDETVALMQQSGRCGKSKATFIAEDGKEIELHGEILSSSSSKVFAKKVHQTDTLSESMQQKNAAKHTLKTHADSEYWLTLEDGTTVHLNYNTKIIFPVRFSRLSRTVYLEGEAYFSVKKESDRPFRVVTPHGMVTEYGTSFNVNTFAPNCTKVILVEGSISVKPKEGMEQQMMPGELAVLRTSSSEAEIAEVAIEPYVAWNRGRFVFENCPLEELMDVMSNWYGVKVEFADDTARQMCFTGDMDRYGSLMPLLQAIRRATSLEIKKNGDTIIIKESIN